MKKLLTRQALLDAGYTYHNKKHLFRLTPHLYQKGISDRGGIKYYLNFWEYRAADAPYPMARDAVESEAQFYLKNGGIVNITRIGISTESLKTVETYYNNMWKCLNRYTFTPHKHVKPKVHHK